MKIREICLIAIFSSVFIFAATGSAVSDEPVDKTIVKYMDVTGDGIDDTVSLHITGESWNKPFTWVLTISSKGTIILKHTSDDTWLDTFFNDEDFVNKTCNTYLACKKQYYLIDLLDRLFIKTDLSPNFHAYDKSNSGSIYFIAKKELIKKYKLSPSEADRTIDWMIRRLKSRQVQVLYVPKSPVETELPRMYVDTVRGFVTIYEW